MTITVQGKTCEYPAGTTFYEIAMQHQAEIPQEILLAKLGTKLYELHKHVPERGGEISFITGADKEGHMAYQRSAIFMMLKAFYHLCADVKDFGVVVDYTLGGGFYCYLRGGVEVTEALLAQVKQTMEAYRDQKIPIMKRSVQTDEAIRMFREVGMTSK